jgi:hypothetical protein
VDGKLTMPNMPDLLTGPRDDPDAVQLALPDNDSVPPPALPGLDARRGIAAAVAGEFGGGGVCGSSSTGAFQNANTASTSAS